MYRLTFGSVSLLLLIFVLIVSFFVFAGSVYAFDRDTPLSNADASFRGENADNYSGDSVASAGDVNGDGYDDFLIGAIWNAQGGMGAGQTYLILGDASTPWGMYFNLSSADASFIGEDSFDYSGSSVASAGDVNGDGYDDFLIGALGDEEGGGPSAGQTYLILGNASAPWGMDFDLAKADASFIGEASFDQSGRSVAGAGDVNGDGYDDFLIGASQNDAGGQDAGQTYLILGNASAPWGMDFDLAKADASFIGEDAGDGSGQSVAGAGDVNGDGYDDFLIGAPWDEEGGGYAGQTYLILGKASGWAMDSSLSGANGSFIGEDKSQYSGCSVAGVGDVNGDGYDDFLIGADENDEGGEDAGQTYLILGKASGWAMDSSLSGVNGSFIGEDEYEYSGTSVAGAGDVNCDGYDDFLIGAPYEEQLGLPPGETYLILGCQAADWGMDFDLANADASFIGVQDDESGSSVAGAGDVNGDGADDFLIGAPYYDAVSTSDEGQAYLLLGTCPPPPAPAQGVPTLSWWGMVGMVALFALVLVWMVRRDWAAKARANG